MLYEDKYPDREIQELMSFVNDVVSIVYIEYIIVIKVRHCEVQTQRFL